jgi:alpha-galactosidase
LAKKRLASAQLNGTRVRTIETKGAARLHTKSVEEMAAEKETARRLAQASDKAQMTLNS